MLCVGVRVVDEAKPLLNKYVGNLTNRYFGIGGFNWTLCKGMEQSKRMTDLPEVTMYCARHTFANIAINKSRMSKDGVALALNHVDNGNQTTNIYISKGWRIVDDVQRHVISELQKVEAKQRKAYTSNII